MKEAAMKARRCQKKSQILLDFISRCCKWPGIGWNTPGAGSLSWTGSRVSMCQDSSHLRRDRPFFSSSSSNKASSSRVSSSSRELDLPNSSHQPLPSPVPNQSPLHCLMYLVFQTCKMSFKRRNDSGGEASASLVRIPLLLIFPTFLFEGEAESKAGCCSLI